MDNKTRVDMRQHIFRSFVLVGATWLVSSPPGACQYDAFELPPGVEQTRIPKQLRPSRPRAAMPVPSASVLENRQIEQYRATIQKYYSEGNFAAAAPIYDNYVNLLKKVLPGDLKLATALQNYADLLRKLNRTSDAMVAEIEAENILTSKDSGAIPFALKEYRLGMTLDDFTKLPPPAGADANVVKSVCSCDKGQDVEVLSEEDKQINVIQCGFWNQKSGQVTGVPYKMTIAGLQCTPDFKFVEDQGVYKLFEISVSFFKANFDDMKQAVVAKYGEPVNESVEKVRTEGGNIYPLTNVVWENPVSKIRLCNADGTNTGKAKLRFIHRRLFLSYAKRIDEQRSGPARQAAKDL